MIPKDCGASDPCCTTWFDVADALRRHIANALDRCSSDECDAFDSFVSHGPPIGPGNYVATFLANARQSNPFDLKGPSITPPVRYRLGAVLVEPGYPGLERQGQSLTLPALDNWTAAARHSYGHAEQMWRSVWKAASLGMFGKCSWVTISECVPDEPETYHSRWRMTVEYEAQLR